MPMRDPQVGDVQVVGGNGGYPTVWAYEQACAALHRAQNERDEALKHLRKLANWGWGENAPDLAKIDWANARYFLSDAS